jgi:hypothetical protein
MESPRAHLQLLHRRPQQAPSGLNDDMDADEPGRLLDIIGELIVANAARCPEFSRAYVAFLNLEAYCEGKYERNDLDYCHTRSEDLAILYDSKVKEAPL